MSKTTKIIAALGVVAGLGVAALPAFTYAAESVTGNAEVQVEVLPAIAMTITGNNDAGTHAVTGTTYVGADGIDVFNPAGIASTEESSEGAGDGVTRYLDGHEIPTANTVGVSSSYITILPNSQVDGDDTNNFKSTVTVYTNNTTGYDLTIGAVNTGTTQDPDYATSLVNGSNEIVANAALTPGQSRWAYKVKTLAKTEAQGGGTAVAETTGNYTALGAPVSIDGIATPTSSGRATTIYYGASTSADIPTGVYSGTVVYTATTNN